jgi:hypothetical protein
VVDQLELAVEGTHCNVSEVNFAPILTKPSSPEAVNDRIFEPTTETAQSAEAK